MDKGTAKVMKQSLENAAVDLFNLARSTGESITEEEVNMIRVKMLAVAEWLWQFDEFLDKHVGDLSPERDDAPF